MGNLRGLFGFLTTLLEIYSLICVIRIFMTWIPSISYSSAGRILSRICDPYLNLFRRLRFLIIGGIDFTPAAALLVLSLGGSLCKALEQTGTFNIFVLLGILVSMIASLVLSILTFLIIILIIRLVIEFMHSGSYGSPVAGALDRFLMPVVYKIAKTFTAGRSITYRNALIISIIVLVAASFVSSVAFNALQDVIQRSAMAVNDMMNKGQQAPQQMNQPFQQPATEPMEGVNEII